MGDPTGGTVPPGPVAGACPLLTVAGNVASCSDQHSTYWLNTCRDYPSDRRQLLPRCSYRFIRIPGAKTHPERQVNS